MCFTLMWSNSLILSNKLTKKNFLLILNRLSDCSCIFYLKMFPVIKLLYSIVYLSALNQTIDLLIDTLVYAIALADQLQHIENESYLSGIILSLSLNLWSICFNIRATYYNSSGFSNTHVHYDFITLTLIFY